VADAKKAETLLLVGKAKEATSKHASGPQGMFAGPLSHGAMQQQIISQPPGVYVIACAMNAEDTADAPLESKNSPTNMMLGWPTHAQRYRIPDPRGDASAVRRSRSPTHTR
jgi:hypothetical protein